MIHLRELTIVAQEEVGVVVQELTDLQEVLHRTPQAPGVEQEVQVVVNTSPVLIPEVEEETTMMVDSQTSLVTLEMTFQADLQEEEEEEVEDLTPEEVQVELEDSQELEMVKLQATLPSLAQVVLTLLESEDQLTPQEELLPTLLPVLPTNLEVPPTSLEEVELLLTNPADLLINPVEELEVVLHPTTQELPRTMEDLLHSLPQPLEDPCTIMLIPTKGDRDQSTVSLTWEIVAISLSTLILVNLKNSAQTKEDSVVANNTEEVQDQEVHPVPVAVHEAQQVAQAVAHLLILLPGDHRGDSKVQGDNTKQLLSQFPLQKI
jgi:hypothetical protein